MTQRGQEGGIKDGECPHQASSIQNFHIQSLVAAVDARVERVGDGRIVHVLEGTLDKAQRQGGLPHPRVSKKGDSPTCMPLWFRHMLLSGP